MTVQRVGRARTSDGLENSFIGCFLKFSQNFPSKAQI